MKSVQSSSIDAVDHDGSALIIKFKSGQTYRYPNAPAHHVDAIATAKSAGRYFQDNIRGKYEHSAS